jgi:hypothetical protein
MEESEEPEGSAADVATPTPVVDAGPQLAPSHDSATLPPPTAEAPAADGYKPGRRSSHHCHLTHVLKRVSRLQARRRSMPSTQNVFARPWSPVEASPLPIPTHFTRGRGTLAQAWLR